METGISVLRGRSDWKTFLTLWKRRFFRTEDKVQTSSVTLTYEKLEGLVAEAIAVDRNARMKGKASGKEFNAP